MGEVYMASSRLTYAFGIMFTYCEMGEQISNHFDEIENGFYQLDWHLLPIEIQRMMVMILMVTKQPMQFVGFGNFTASRITMRAVNHSFFYFNHLMGTAIEFN